MLLGRPRIVFGVPRVGDLSFYRGIAWGGSRFPLLVAVGGDCITDWALLGSFFGFARIGIRRGVFPRIGNLTFTHNPCFGLGRWVGGKPKASFSKFAELRKYRAIPNVF